MLKYVGNGFALPGVPARDLTDEEVEAAGGEAFLLEPHPVVLYALYEREGKKAARNADLQAAKEVADKIEGGD